MTGVKRLSAALCVFGTVGVVAACTTPTDAELDAATTATETEAATNPTEDTDEASSAISAPGPSGRRLASGEASEDESFVDPETGEVSSAIHDEFRRCDWRDNFHCRRHHRGWRWVRMRDDRWGDERWDRRPYRPGRDRYCCVRTWH